MNSTRLSIVTAGACALMLSACQTSFDEFRQNFSDNFQWPSLGSDEQTGTSSTETQETAVISVDGLMECPKVKIVDDLARLSEFSDPLDPSPKTLVSEVTLSNERGTCVYNQADSSVAVQVSLVFDSHLGPRSKIYKGDRPNFAYPYFIAVTAPDGEIVAKEVFAASVSYGSDQKSIQHKETLRQIIPLNSAAEGPQYTLLAGFQLSEEQLEYNRDNISLESAMAPTVIAEDPVTKEQEKPELSETSEPGQTIGMKPIIDDPDPVDTESKTSIPPANPAKPASKPRPISVLEEPGTETTTEAAISKTTKAATTEPAKSPKPAPEQAKSPVSEETSSDQSASLSPRKPVTNVQPPSDAELKPVTKTEPIKKETKVLDLTEPVQ